MNRARIVVLEVVVFSVVGVTAALVPHLFGLDQHSRKVTYRASWLHSFTYCSVKALGEPFCKRVGEEAIGLT